ncbi:RES family NAD+ phosphorylase [Indioceanicola profundi]|uniref:RES family NAD+ phosphorylase n=1 Tax=Indioceanicola profundi TaxID=2220096 RepID=UPI000E6AD048|nr:RES family NAD+ phosphorylase [Indioceanicola profundi]
MVAPPTENIDWRPAYRIIRTIYPPVFLFEDIADPADWDLIASAEAKTNPRVRDQVGNLSLVPADKRLSGPTASLAMGAFTHASPDRPGRFSDGSYGIWYCGDRFEVALMETVHHHERFMRRTHEPAGSSQFRELNARVACALHSIRGGGFDACLDPDSWAAGQALGASLRASGGNGILYPSVRYPAGNAAALFWPNLISLPITQARTLYYHWDGARVSRYFIAGGANWYGLP